MENKEKKKNKSLKPFLKGDYYKTIIDSSLDMIITVDSKRRIVEFNKSAQKIFGYTLEEVLGKPVDILYANPEEGEKISKEVIKKGRCIAEVTNKRKNGELFPSLVSASLLKDSKGKIIGVMGISRDISELKLFEQKLENASQEWRATFDALKDCLILIDKNGIIKRCNLSFTSLVKMPFQEIIGKNFPELFNIPPQLCPYFKSMESLKRESTLIEKEGRWLNITSDPIIRNNEFDGAVIIISDITEIKNWEEKLRKSEERYRLLFESTPDTIFTIRHGIFTSLNPAFERVTGWKIKDWIGKHFSHIVHPEDLPIAYENYKKIISEKSIVKFEIRVRSKSGTYLIGDHTVAPLFEKGEVVGIIGVVRDITNYKKAIDQLKESEERFRMLTENSPIGISLLKPDNTFEYLNPQFTEIFGYNIHDIHNKEKWFELAYPDEKIRERAISAWREDFVDSKEFGKIKEKEFPIRCKNGEEKIVRIRSLLMHDGKILQTYEDITEKIKAESILKESERKFRTLIENATDIISMFDAEGKIIYISPSVERILGYRNEDVMGLSIFNFLHPSELEPAIETFKKITTEAIISSPLRFRVRHKDGSWRHLEAVFNNLIGDPQINAVLMNARDITAIVSAEKKYRNLFEESKDVVYIADPNGRIIDINPAGVELFGFSSKEEILKVNMKELYFNPEDRQKFKEAIEKNGYVKDFEIVLKKKNGERIIVLDTGTVVKDEKGNVVAYRGIMRDVTEYKRLEQQLLHAQKMDAIGNLAGGIAHDFNNMLQVILGFTDLALSKLDSSNPLINDLLKIKRTTERAAELVQKLLAFSRKQILEKRVIDINKLINEHVEMLKRVIPENIELIVSTKAKNSTVLIDPTGIEQVIMNIVLNARDAMPDGGTLWIETGNEVVAKSFPKEERIKPGEYVTISIKDTGIGMDEEILSRIFEPFYSTKGKDKGLGLGLAVAWGIIKQHDGNIEVFSSPGKGSTFKISLPVYQNVEEKVEIREESKIEIKGKETILIAEDEEGIRELLNEILVKYGYKVILAKDGLEAIELFETYKDKIDLLILDIVMPKVGGYEVYKSISYSKKDIPTIFMTGYSEERFEDKIKNNELVSLVTKPFTPESILQKVREMIDKSKKR